MDATSSDLAVRVLGAILWLVVRAVRSPWVRTGVLLMLCGLMLSAVVTDANAGVMPVVGIPSTVAPSEPDVAGSDVEHAAAILADQAELGLFSVGDISLLFGALLL